MFISKQYRPELAASKDITRQNLTRVLIDTDAKRAVATNGHWLIAVPVTIDEGQKRSAIDPSVFAHARRVKTEVMTAVSDGTIHVQGVAFPATDGSDFPPWKQVVPEYTETFEIGVNAEYLAQAQRAIGAKCVRLRFKRLADGTIDALEPILADNARESGEALAVIMPCRV